MLKITDWHVFSDLGGLCPLGTDAKTCPFSGAPTISPNEVGFVLDLELLNSDTVFSLCSSFIMEYAKFH